MKIMVKPNSFNIKKKNADAFLFGIKGLSTFNTSTVTIKRLKRLVNTNKEIYVSIDKNIFNKDIVYLKKVLRELSKINIKGLFFYDLSILNINKELGLNLNLIWNQNFLVTNYKTCNYYFDEGVKSSLVSSEITSKEICEIKNNTKQTLFVNIFGYQLMAFSKRKLITSYFKYIKRPNFSKKHFMSEKDNKYMVKETKEGTIFISDHILNGITKINEFKKVKIDYIVLDEFGISKAKFNKVLEIFNKVVKEKVSDEMLEEENQKIKNIINNTSTIFLDKETIYKVKTNG